MATVTAIERSARAGFCSAEDTSLSCVDPDGNGTSFSYCGDDGSCSHTDADFVYSGECHGSPVYSCANLRSCECAIDGVLPEVFWPEVPSSGQPPVQECCGGGGTSSAYQVGDVVQFEHLDYQCRQAHVPQPGWEPPNTPALWARINTRGAWAPQVLYSAGQETAYGPRTYRVVQGHQSQVGWEPPAVPALWAPVWNTQDIGGVGAAGSLVQSGSKFTVKGAGEDIYGNDDEFRFVYKAISGDATITAKVTSIDHVDGWSKAGVMVRDGLGAGARNVMMLTTPTPSNGYRWQVRSSVSGTTSSTKGGPGTNEVWLRIIRNGSTLTGKFSSNGTSWTTLGTAPISMASTVQIGLAVTSHADSSLAAGLFDKVSITTP
jgi:regulation of enolase protein 1 (concanavalin A-like superfamily)